MEISNSSGSGGSKFIEKSGRGTIKNIISYVEPVSDRVVAGTSLKLLPPMHMQGGIVIVDFDEEYELGVKSNRLRVI